MAVTLKRLLPMHRGRFGWDRRGEEQQLENAAGSSAAISDFSFSNPGF
jgi:hypothetical protein